MRIRIIAVLIAIAVVLGVASWYLVDSSAEMSGPAYAWFFWLPGWAHYWLWPESAFGLMVMTMAVYAVQYLAVFGLLVLLPCAARVMRDFLRPHQHRAGLISR